jgi:hypothetical protein
MMAITIVTITNMHGMNAPIATSIAADRNQRKRFLKTEQSVDFRPFSH